MNKKINRLHEKCLYIVYSGSGSSFKALLHKEKNVSIHVENVEDLAIKMLKLSKKLHINFCPNGDQNFSKRNNTFLIALKGVARTGVDPWGECPVES